jgi:hypothetical protein
MTIDLDRHLHLVDQVATIGATTEGMNGTS